MPALVPACYRFLSLHRKGMFILIALCLFACGPLSLRMEVREDIRALVPTGSPAFEERFAFLRRAPFMRLIAVTVGSVEGEPQPWADAVAGKLRQGGLAAATGPGFSFSPDGLARLCALAPALLGPDAIHAFGGDLTEAGIRAALQRDVKLMLSPAGMAMRELVRLDPLRLHERLFQRLAALKQPGGYTIKDDHFVDPGGRYALVLARPEADMADSLASGKVMEQIRQAVNILPHNVERHIVGSYRHSETNAAVIKDDLLRVLPLSLLLVSGIFVIFLRSRQAALIFAVPAAAVCLAGLVTEAVYGTISGLVLGFGSVLLGITSDYAVHAYYSASGPAGVEAGLARLTRPLLTGAATTAAAFGALFCSSIPAIRQVALFGLSGIAAALVLALFVLPHLFRTSCGSALAPAFAQTATARPRFPALLVFPALLLAVAGGFASLRFDGDIRNLSYVSDEIRRDEAAAARIWKNGSNGALIVAAGDDTEQGFEKALRINDEVWRLLQEKNLPASSIAPLLPSRKKQEESLAAWRLLWRERGQSTLDRLALAAKDAGLSPVAFAPFIQWISEAPALVSPETLRALGAGAFLDMTVSRRNEQTLVFTMLPQGGEPDAALAAALEKAGATVVSGETFRKDIAEAGGRDIFRFCLLALLSTVGAVALLFRTPARCLLVLLPVLSALACTLALFAVLRMEVNMFHAVALPLVIALSVDYGIFMQAVLEGGMDAAGKTGVAVSALTTLAGFGSLLLARHPALFSLGITVSGGIAAALAAALWLQPLLARMPDSAGDNGEAKP